MKKKRGSKKAVSPIIATVLLIMIVIILAIIILMWSRGFIKEIITKEIAGNEKRVNELCLEVKMNPIKNEDGSFGFENIGNIPIYAFNVKLVGGGSSEIIKISKEERGSVNPGFTTIISKPGITSYSDYELIKIIPILLGKSEKSEAIKEFPCPEEQGLII